MPSLRSRLLLFLMKNRHLFKFRLRKERVNWNENASILRFRQECEKAAAQFGKIPREIEISPVEIDDMYAEWILPPGRKKEKVILFVHGGGYVCGSCADHRNIVARFVKKNNVGALLYEYRLAPEHPFPGALDDSVKAYRWLLAKDFMPADIVLVGDSAGGGLCLATLLALRDQDVPLPAAAVAISPWTDLKCSGDSYRTNAKKCLSPEGSCTAFCKHYAGDHDPGHPWISPLYGDLQGLPPILVFVADNEVLYDDSVFFAEKAQAAGVDVTLKVGKGLFHCYPLCAPLFPEATLAMADIWRFIRMHLRCENDVHNRSSAGDTKSGATCRQ